MKQTLLYTLAGIALLASCSNFEADHSALSDKEISFKVTTNGSKQVEAESRVTPINDDNITNFGVVAFRRASNASIASMTPNFIYDAEVAKNGDKWTTSERQFWPMNSDVLDFYAYAPYHAEGITLSSASATGVPTITYDASSQLDLITAIATNQSFSVAATGAGVPLTFNHALTTIKFEKDDGMSGTIESISIKNVYNSGTLTIGGSWNFSGVTRSNVSATEGVALTMIPQQFSDSEQLIEVVYIYHGNKYTLQHQLSGSSWTAGSTITYDIASPSLLKIKYDNDVVVTPWDNANEVAMAMMIENYEVFIGDFLCSDGSVVSPEKLATSGKTPIAIVFSTETSATDKAHGWTHGYAMALTNVHDGNSIGKYVWANQYTDVAGIPNVGGGGYTFEYIGGTDMDGYTHTTYLNSPDFPAGYAAKTIYESQVPSPVTTSGWFLPSNGQWYQIMINLGGLPASQYGAWEEDDVGRKAASYINSKLRPLDSVSVNYDTFLFYFFSFWNSNEYSADYAYYTSFENDSEVRFAIGFDKFRTFIVRPVIAF